MKEVAKRAGVSLMTVSRVLNNTALVRPETRKRVEQAVADLNYRPNLGARRLAGGRSMFIGLLYHNPSPGYLSKVLRGSIDACREHGHHLVLEDFGKSSPYNEPEVAVRKLNLADLDGLIVTPPLSVHKGFMAAVEASGLPVVRVSPDNIHADRLQVAIDDSQAVEDLLDSLIGMGHTHISFVQGPSSHAASKHRLDGFLRGMRKHDLPTPQNLRRVGDFTYRSGLVSGTSLLESENPPTAIMASNDDMAAGIIGAAHMMGLKVPDDVSIVGFDDIELATTIWPELTTVRQPIVDMASQAVALLTAFLRRDEEGIAAHRGLLPYEIALRGSVGPPKIK
jgi:LacI family transcriptional regulator